MNGRRVLVVGHFLSGHVATRSVAEELAAQLAAADWRVTTTSSARSGPARLLDIQRTIWARRREYEVAQVDVFSGGAFLWARAACRSLAWLRKPFVLTLHGGLLPELARRRPRTMTRLLGSAAAVTVPSTYLRAAMRPYRPDVVVLPNPLRIDSYPFERRRLLRPRLIWIRAFHRVYNPSLAIRVLARLLPDRPDATLAMVGPDKGDGSLDQARATANELGVGDRVTWYPDGVPKIRIPDLLTDADVFLNTTDVDNTPVTVQEALACGLCVVSTDAGGLRHLLSDGDDALLVPRDDAEGMAAAVGRLLADPDLALRLSRNGRRKVETFDWRHLLPRWESLLLGAQGQGR